MTSIAKWSRLHGEGKVWVYDWSRLLVGKGGGGVVMWGWEGGQEVKMWGNWWKIGGKNVSNHKISKQNQVGTKAVIQISLQVEDVCLLYGKSLACPIEVEKKKKGTVIYRLKGRIMVFGCVPLISTGIKWLQIHIFLTPDLPENSFCFVY